MTIWTVYKVVDTIPGGRGQSLKRLGNVAAGGLVEAINRAEDEWPTERDPSLPQLGFIFLEARQRPE